MSQTDHSIVEDSEGDATIYRCEDCGLIYQSKETFQMYRCSPIHETTEQKRSETPPDSTEFDDSS